MFQKSCLKGVKKSAKMACLGAFLSVLWTYKIYLFLCRGQLFSFDNYTVLSEFQCKTKFPKARLIVKFLEYSVCKNISWEYVRNLTIPLIFWELCIFCLTYFSGNFRCFDETATESSFTISSRVSRLDTNSGTSLSPRCESIVFIECNVFWIQVIASKSFSLTSFWLSSISPL